MLHKNLPFIPIMVFAITSFSCVVQEYLISLNAIRKNLLSNKSPYFTIYCSPLSLVSVCMLSSYFFVIAVFRERNDYLLGFAQYLLQNTYYTRGSHLKRFQPKELQKVFSHCDILQKCIAVQNVRNCTCEIKLHHIWLKDSLEFPQNQLEHPVYYQYVSKFDYNIYYVETADLMV